MPPATRLLATDIIRKVTGQELEFKRIGRYRDQSFYGIGLPSLFATQSTQDVTQMAGGIVFETGGRQSGGLGWWRHTPYDTVNEVAGALREANQALVTLQEGTRGPTCPRDNPRRASWWIPFRSVFDMVLL